MVSPLHVAEAKPRFYTSFSSPVLSYFHSQGKLRSSSSMAVPVDPAVAAPAPARAVEDPGLPAPPIPPAQPAEAVGGQQEQLNEVY